MYMKVSDKVKVRRLRLVMTWVTRTRLFAIGRVIVIDR